MDWRRREARRRAPSLVRAAAVLLAAALPGSALAEDCTPSAGALDRLICARPDLRQAEDRMMAAYGVLRDALPPERRFALRDSQQDWMEAREKACPASRGSEPAALACLAERTEARGRMLAAASGRPPLLPSFMRQKGTSGLYDISIEYPQLPSPSSPAELQLNAALKAAAEGDGRWRRRAEAAGTGPLAYQVRYDVGFASPHFVSVGFTREERSGTATTLSTAVVNMDLDRDRPLALDDMIEADAVEALTGSCEAQVAVVLPADSTDAVDRAALGALVADPATWLIGRNGVVLRFPAGSVAPRPLGTLTCQLSYAMLAPFKKPGAPLPPRD